MRAARLRVLTLDQSGVGDDGAAALGSALLANSRLTSLELGYNRISSRGAAALAGAPATRVGALGSGALASALAGARSVDALGVGRRRPRRCACYTCGRASLRPR